MMSSLRPVFEFSRLRADSHNSKATSACVRHHNQLRARGLTASFARAHCVARARLRSNNIYYEDTYQSRPIIGYEIIKHL